MNLNFKTTYRHFRRRLDDMDTYEKTRFYAITGIGVFALLIIAGLIVLFSFRHLGVVISVDTAGLLGKPAVFVNNTSSSTIKHVYVEMDEKYTTVINKIKPGQSVVLYFVTFNPTPPKNYRPKKITVKSGIGIATESLPVVSR